MKWQWESSDRFLRKLNMDGRGEIQYSKPLRPGRETSDKKKKIFLAVKANQYQEKKWCSGQHISSAFPTENTNMLQELHKKKMEWLLLGCTLKKIESFLFCHHLYSLTQLCCCKKGALELRVVCFHGKKNRKYKPYFGEGEKKIEEENIWVYNCSLLRISSVVTVGDFFKNPTFTRWRNKKNDENS